MSDQLAPSIEQLVKKSKEEDNQVVNEVKKGPRGQNFIARFRQGKGQRDNLRILAKDSGLETLAPQEKRIFSHPIQIRIAESTLYCVSREIIAPIGDPIDGMVASSSSLIIVDEDLQARTGEGNLTIGRTESNDIMIVDPYVSRHQLTVGIERNSRGKFTVENGIPTNPTKVGEIPQFTMDTPKKLGDKEVVAVNHTGEERLIVAIGKSKFTLKRNKAMNWDLVGEDGTTHALPIGEGGVYTATIGRNPTNDIVLLDPHSSREHLKILGVSGNPIHNTVFFFKDMGATNKSTIALEAPSKALPEVETSIVGSTQENIRDEIMQKLEIRGSAYKEQVLTKSILEKYDLLPRHEVVIDDLKINISRPYRIGYDRIAVVGYMHSGDRVVAKSFYRSNSQGVWRYLPNYTTDDYGDINWYSKGHGEESVTLPIPLQKALAEISAQDLEAEVSLDEGTAELVFAGTARKSDADLIKGAYHMEVRSNPARLKGRFYTEPGERMLPPETMIFTNKKDEPNFKELKTNWKQKTALYGEITIEVYSSNRGNLNYMFCRDSNKRVWIGGIEDTSKIGSTGLRKKWIDGGCLTTPAYEYRKQSGGYGNEHYQNIDHPEYVDIYVDMFENYLSKIPVIQNYLKYIDDRATV